MDDMVDSFEHSSKNPEIKRENVWDNCLMSPLNSISTTSKLNSNNISEDSYGNSSAAMTSRENLLLVDVEIGTKTIENIPVKCECSLEDLAKEFAENETIKVVYFLNEKITKGAYDCDVAEAQVLVKLRPNWKWLPVESLVEDPSVTVQEAFADIPDHFKPVFGLVPKVQRTLLAPSSSMLPSTSHSEDPLTAMLTQLKDVFTKYPVSDVFNKDNHSEKDFTNEVNCHGLTQNKTKELKSLITKLNTLLHTQHQETPLQKHTTVQPQSTHPEQQIQIVIPSQTPSTSSDTSLLNHYMPEGDVSMATTSDQAAGAPLSRLRTQFDQNFEVPRLKEWFADNAMPSRTMISDYVKQMNAEEIRQGKQPVTDRAVYIWFKNTRARKFKKKPWIQS